MKQTVYKLTDEEGYTRRCQRNECKWGPEVTHTAKGQGGLCSDGVIHAYASPLLAVLMNPIHCDFSKPLLWEAECDVTHNDGTKLGAKQLTTLKTLRLPEVSTRQRVIFAILCAEKALSITRCDHPRLAEWRRWAQDYKDGKAAYAAANAVAYAYAGATRAVGAAGAARAAGYAGATRAVGAVGAVGAAGYAANAAANAAAYAYAAAGAVGAAGAARAAGAAGYAANAAACAAANAAAYAYAAYAYAAAANAAAANAAAVKLDLVAIAEETMKF